MPGDESIRDKALGPVAGIAARVFFVAVVLGQIYFIHRGYEDPHKHFAFQPFNESDTFKARIVRVTRDGERIPVTKKWSGYRWRDLVRARGLDRAGNTLHASAGARSVLTFLDEALDWVADNTPRDEETLYYEADVVYKHNRRGPYRAAFRSKERDLPPAPRKLPEAAPSGPEASEVEGDGPS